MVNIKENYSKVLSQVKNTAISSLHDPEKIVLICVSKKKDAKTVQQGIDSGINNLGEVKFCKTKTLSQ